MELAPAEFRRELASQNLQLSPQPYSVVAVVPIVQRRKLRLKEALGLARVTQLEGGRATGVSEPRDCVLATPSLASVKTLGGRTWPSAQRVLGSHLLTHALV